MWFLFDNCFEDCYNVQWIAFANCENEIVGTMATGMMGQEKNFKSLCHMTKFLSWKLDPKIRDCIKETCFKHFLSIPKTTPKLYMKLITALTKFYNLEKNAFAFGEKNGSMFYVDIRLEDILYSTGLPIDELQVFNLNFVFH